MFVNHRQSTYFCRVQSNNPADSPVLFFVLASKRSLYNSVLYCRELILCRKQLGTLRYLDENTI